MYWQSDCLGVDFEKKLITVEQAREGGRIIQVGYEQLLLSTGSTVSQPAVCHIVTHVLPDRSGSIA